MKTFTVEKLRKYSCASTGGIVLVALNGKVYDVTGDRELFGTGEALHDAVTNSPVQNQKTVTAHSTSEQLLSVGFAETAHSYCRLLALQSIMLIT